MTIAAEGGDVATVDVLLQHHAKVTALEAPNVADALEVATMNGDAAIVQRLLDHAAICTASSNYFLSPPFRCHATPP